MKRNKSAFCAVILAFCLSMTFVLQPLPAQAASKPAANSNGKYLYYHGDSQNIYRMDTNTGKAAVILKDYAGLPWDRIACHKGYMYWDWNVMDFGPVFRMNAKGGKIQKLAGYGTAPVVYNNKIYYYGGKPLDGIYRMDLSGRNKKKIISKADVGNRYRFFQILNNRIYYPYPVGYDEAETLCALYSADLSGKGIRRESSKTVRQLHSDGRDIYYTTKDAVHRISGKTGKDTKLTKLSWSDYDYNMEILDVYNGVIYFKDNSGSLSKLKKYVVSKGTTATLKSFKNGDRVTYMWAGQGQYAVLLVSIYSSGQVYARIKKDGSGYKPLQ